jgi:S-adenosylmethionine:tRNA ribosyltransferase-isomerase
MVAAGDLTAVRPEEFAAAQPPEEFAAAEPPEEFAAAEPPEARGLRRDEVRLLVSDLERDSIEHARFLDLPRWLSPGDLLVVNTSGTLNAALTAESAGGEIFELHLSTPWPGVFYPTVPEHAGDPAFNPSVADHARDAAFWTVEVRQPAHGTSRPAAGQKSRGASLPYSNARAGTTLELPGGAQATLLAPYPLVNPRRTLGSRSRLWVAALRLHGLEGRGPGNSVTTYLDRYGFPIRYGYVTRPWPSSMYQTVFATEAGSAEMPSAGRPFTPELVTRLVSLGIQIAPLLLHAGVASLESHEPPYAEFYRVSRDTADRVNSTRRAGHRVVAVGTTAVRALETVTDQRGTTVPGQGWTSLVITPDRPVRSVNGLITGLHEPRATHLAILQQIAARSHLERAYAEARQAGYLWHEFGDAHLILGASSPRRRGAGS